MAYSRMSSMPPADTSTPTAAKSTPARKPVHLESRQWSCSELAEGQAALKKAKLEKMDTSDVLEADLEAG